MIENESNVFMSVDKHSSLFHGFKSVCDAVSKTLGAAGKNALLQDLGRPFHRVTNDGISIAHAIHFKNKVAEMGANIAREVSKRANDQSGDGTSTALTLAPLIIEKGLEYRKTMDGSEIKRSIDECLPIMEKLIDDQTRPCETYEEIKAVAITSAEVESLGTMVADIYQTIGKDGFIEVDNSRNTETTWEETKGVRFLGARAYSPTFLQVSGSGDEFVQENPQIFITTQPIRDPKALHPLMRLFAKLDPKERKDFILVVDEVDDKVEQALLGLAFGDAKRGVPPTTIMLIKAPSIDKDNFFDDMAELTGAKILRGSSGVTLGDISFNEMGTCERITVTGQTVTVFGGKDLTEYSHKLKETLDEDTPLLKERLACLSGKAAKLKVGAKSESELSHLKDKAEDCVNSTKLAMQNGIVAGGGVALLNVIAGLPDTIGGKILKEALEAPARTIRKNAGVPALEGYDYDGKNFTGFNARTREVVDMFYAGIVDSSSVVKNSLRSAVGVAGIMLTVEDVIILPEPDVRYVMQPPQ
jgi:chaperonin GroEL